MQFLSLHFVIFLLALFALVQASGNRPAVRNSVLLAASYYFYMCWDWRFAVLLLINTLINYYAARAIAAAATERGRHLGLAAALVGSLGILAYFKYANFFIESAASLLESLGLHSNLPVLDLMLPVGISFFTFQSLSYTLDVYRRQQAPCESLRDFALFVSFFPTVLSGPIVRARQLLPQIQSSAPVAPERFESGLVLLMRGFVKKVMFADPLGMHLVDPAFADPSAYPGWFLLLAVYAYTFQIYMDLSGYTDIARGTSRLLGFELPDSFNRPYLADSVSNFWQRWHITMSGFFRDYLFFSLGGSRAGNAYFNLVVTFVAIGLWHGAGWKFVLYGLLHGSMVAAERWARSRRQRLGLPPLPEHGWAWLLRILLVFQFVALSRILFRAHDLAEAHNYVNALLAWHVGTVPVSIIGLGALAGAALLHLVPTRQCERLMDFIRRQPVLPQAAALVLAIFVLVALATEVNSFIYFKF